MTTKDYEVTFKMEVDEDIKVHDVIEDLLANFDPRPGSVRTYEVLIKDLGYKQVPIEL